jgi:hypothetical protein
VLQRTHDCISQYGRFLRKIPVALPCNTNQLAPSAHVSFRKKVATECESRDGFGSRVLSALEIPLF